MPLLPPQINIALFSPAKALTQNLGLAPFCTFCCNLLLTFDQNKIFPRPQHGTGERQVESFPVFCGRVLPALSVPVAAAFPVPAARFEILPGNRLAGKFRYPAADFPHGQALHVLRGGSGIQGL